MAMATVREHVLLSQPGKQVLLAEIPASASRDSQPAVTLRLLVEQCSDYGAGPADVDTVEDVACRVPLADLVRQGAAERAFKELVARIDNPALRPEVAAETAAAAVRVRARCGADDRDGLRGVEFRLRVTFIDDASREEEEADHDDDECGSDMEFGEFDLSGARSLRGQQTDASYDYEEEDDDEDGCGAQFTVRPYRGALARGAPSSMLLSGFEARSDGPELTEEHEVTSYDIQRVVRKALGGGGSVEDDEAYLRALDGGTPVSPASRAAMVGQALQSARQQQQQQRSKSPRPIFPMRTGF
ncbi:hypothetical protein CFC21_056612 [Triticum aestivum]|uniref:Uncharacterized protein n=2 Tax=Triticum aestivum TaxID=4565 RepID=A0A3B6INH9_WHEAT|nr:uncharacterized protein LOC119293334 [Triticum dicoccoides]XP_044372364.1 uncharacterized protein LOC123094419 [Triticum aestivum]KAF7047723.1 hypothetical protein CFC21_056612 [Triticum aestivum]